MNEPESRAPRHELIKDAFNAALDQPQDARVAFLRAAYAPDVVVEVRSLLDAYDHADAFLERPALANPGAAAAFEAMLPVPGATAVPIGTRLGPYVITADIGEGGMGHVFRAQRADEAFEQAVAIKVVRADIATPAMVERLRQERRILAALDHPNIARLIDGGSTASGLPYAVMELVDGDPIDRYVTAHALDLPARLRLFRLVCGAVQYAHERLVVHRDLKPGNILVTADGTPKLLDFGISKILAPDDADPGNTRTGWSALTPRYASPEQVRGEPVGVASDVYALGVLGYELFAGVSPYGAAATGSRTELERAILDHDPAWPSRVATAAHPRALRGDLDRILLKALEKLLERRYANVEQLRDDLDRYTEGRPVSVGPDAWTYRARKFARRHRLGVTAAATGVLTLAAGGATTWYQARVARHERAVAEERFDQVRALANAFLFEFPNAIKDRTGTTAARTEAVTRALAYLDGLPGAASDDPRLLAETARAYLDLGDVLGNPYVANLGEPDRAEASYTKALARTERLTARAGATPDDWLLLVRAQKSIGDIRWSKADTAGALARYQAAYDLTNAPGAGPDRPALKQMRGHALYLLGQTQLKAGRLAAAQPLFTRAVAEAKACLAMFPGDAPCGRVLSVAELKLGDVYRVQGDLVHALEHSREASRLAHESAQLEPDRRDLKRTAMVFDIRLASDFASTGDMAGATAMFDKTCDTAAALAAVDPSDVQAASDVGSCFNTWAHGALEAGDLATSAHAYERAIAAFTPLARENAHYEYRQELARAHGGLASVARQRADYDAALAANERAQRLFEGLIALTPAVGPYLADTYEETIESLIARGRRTDRAAPAREADFTNALSYVERYTRLMTKLGNDGLLEAGNAGWERRIAERADEARAGLSKRKPGG